MALRLLRRLRGDRRGVSAIEFAFIAPILILCYFGVAELCGALLAERKASHVASEVGDLVAQCQYVAATDFTNDFWPVGAAVLSPLTTSNLAMRITSFVKPIRRTTVFTVGLLSMDNGGHLTAYTAGHGADAACADRADPGQWQHHHVGDPVRLHLAGQHRREERPDLQQHLLSGAASGDGDPGARTSCCHAIQAPDQRMVVDRFAVDHRDPAKTNEAVGQENRIRLGQRLDP